MVSIAMAVLPVEKVNEFQTAFLEMIELKYAEEMNDLNKKGVLTDEFKEKLLEAARSVRNDILNAIKA